MNGYRSDGLRNAGWMSQSTIASFVAAIYFGGLVCQVPIGWSSDRMDRRVLILGLAGVGGLVALLAALLPGWLPLILVAAAVVGGAIARHAWSSFPPGPGPSP